MRGNSTRSLNSLRDATLRSSEDGKRSDRDDDQGELADPFEGDAPDGHDEDERFSAAYETWSTVIARMMAWTGAFSL